MSNTVNNYTETDLGNISLNPRGEYDDSAEYEYLDTVSYQGGSYFCLAELETTITGIAPDAGHNSEHWQMIAVPGDMTPEYTATYNDVIKKAVQVEISRAAVELAQQEIEAAQTDVQQLHSDTVQTAQEAENSKNSAANSAQSAEQSRKTVSESEQNINGQITGFDSRVSEAVEQSKAEINTTKQQAIDTITNQQNTSVNAVKTEGEKIITRVGNDAKTVADDRVTVEEAAQTVLNNAQEVAQNTQTVAGNTKNAAASAESAKNSADNAVQSAKSVEDASKQIEQNKKDVDSLKEDFRRVSPSAEYIGKNLVIPSVKDILVDKTTHYGKTLDTTKAGNSEKVYTDNVDKNCSALNAIESNTAYTIFSVGHNQRLQLFWRIAFYDSNYAYIKSIYDVTRFTSPDNAAYFIVDTYSTDCSVKSEALESFSMVYVVNGTYDFEQIRSIFPLHNNKLENTRATTGYEGKTWMCIGDSITEHNFRALFNYHDYASKELGINIINCGISGSGYIIHDSDENSATIPPFYKRIEGYANAGYKPDLITIFGGINDLMFTDAPVGENTDMTVGTLLGGVNLVIAKIKQYFPNVPFGIISPLPAYACQDSGTCYADYSPSNKTNKEYLFIAALADYCDYHGIPFLNQYNQTGFRPWDENFRTEYTKYSPSASPDGLHPNAKGHALIYPKIREFIKTLM